MNKELKDFIIVQRIESCIAKCMSDLAGHLVLLVSDTVKEIGFEAIGDLKRSLNSLLLEEQKK